MIRLILIIISLFFLITGLLKSADWWWNALIASFIIGNTIFPKLYILSKSSIPYLIYYLVSFLRYALTPFLFILSNESYKSYMLREPSENGIKIACILMILELLCSLSLINLLAKKKYSSSDSFKYEFSSNGLLIVLSILIVIVLFVFPQLALKYHFIFIPDELVKSELDFTGIGIVSIFTDYILIFPPLVFMNYFIFKYYKKNKINYIYYLLFLLVPFLLFFKGVSRFSALLPALAWATSLIIVLPFFKRLILTIVTSTSSIVVISVTLFKQFGYTTTNKTNISTGIGDIAITFNAYFSGLFNVAYVVDLVNLIDTPNGDKLILNDFLKNIAFLSNFANTKYTSSYYFNNYIYSSSGQADQIIPIVGQSYMYFGLSGFLIMPIICVLLLIYLEFKINYINNVNFVFCFTLLTIYFSVSMMISLNSLYPFLFNFIVPLILILRLNKLFSKAKFL